MNQILFLTIIPWIFRPHNTISNSPQVSTILWLDAQSNESALLRVYW